MGPKSQRCRRRAVWCKRSGWSAAAEGRIEEHLHLDVALTLRSDEDLHNGVVVELDRSIANRTE